MCRRCAERRREQALCPACAAVEARAESPDFARVLLLQHRRRVLATRHLARTAFATLVPGGGLLAFRRFLRPLVLLTIVAGLAGHVLGPAAPFTYEPRLALPEPAVPVAVLVAVWVAVYVVSITSYFTQVARANAQEAANSAPVRSRSVQSTRRAPAAAA